MATTMLAKGVPLLRPLRHPSPRLLPTRIASHRARELVTGTVHLGRAVFARSAPRPNVLNGHRDLAFFKRGRTQQPTLHRRLATEEPGKKPDDFRALIDRWTLNPDGTLKKNVPGRLRGLWKKYGMIAVGTYFGVYVVTLSTIYAGIEAYAWSIRHNIMKQQGIKNKEEINKLIVEKMGLQSFPAAETLVSTLLTLIPGLIDWGTIAIAWIATKFTEPIRLAVTLAITPSVARLLGRRLLK